MAETTVSARWRRLGLLLAADTFLLHAAIDFDFAMPSLVLLCALFLGWASSDADIGSRRAGPFEAWVPAIALCLVCLAYVQGELSLEAATQHPETASTALERGLAFNPLDERLWVSAAVEARRNGQADRAREYLNRAVSLSPDSAWIRGQRAAQALEARRVFEAHSELMAAQRLFPQGDYDRELVRLEALIESALDESRQAPAETPLE